LGRSLAQPAPSSAPAARGLWRSGQQRYVTAQTAKVPAALAMSRSAL